MIVFPNAKINIGLNIISKRADGFHDIETVFYPVQWCDVLEMASKKNSNSLSDDLVDFHTSGKSIPDKPDDNLCMKALMLLSQDFSFPLPVMYLHKSIPSRAGLGGGSSDAAFCLKLLSKLFNLNLSPSQMENYARKLGSDCAFFINNKPVFACEKGDVFKPIELILAGYYIVIIKPPVSVGTAEAYSGIIPAKSKYSLQELIRMPVELWKDKIVNDFEESIFKKYPLIGHYKNMMYNQGAVYASMSGSGSSVYGIFKQNTDLRNLFANVEIWQGILQ